MRPRNVELPIRFEPEFPSLQLSVFGATPAVKAFLNDDSRSPLHCVDFERRPGRQLYRPLDSSSCLGRLRALRRINANLGEIGQKMRRPPVDIVLAHLVAHVPHGGSLFLFGHLQRTMDGVGQL